jgi:hypothetical protein
MEENKFKCDVCHKYYKSYQSLWNHKKKIHSKSPQDNSNKPQDNSKSPQINSIISNEPINKLTCKYCSKIYSRMDNLNRHIKACKLKEDNTNNETAELKKEIVELKKMVADFINYKSNTINNTNNGNHSNNTTNNTNNGTINNNYITIVPFTKENFVELSTQDEQLLILKQEGHNAIYKCIELKHFNDKYPQFHNFMIPNKRTNDALVYDGDIEDFKLNKKDNAVDDAITYAGFDIEEMFSLHENDINDKQKTNIERIISDTTPTPKYVEEHISSMGYNYRNKVKNTYKKTRKQQQSLE